MPEEDGDRSKRVGVLTNCVKNYNFSVCWFYCMNAKCKGSKTWKTLFIKTYWEPNATMFLGLNFSFWFYITWMARKICRMKLVVLVQQRGSVRYVRKLLI